MPDNLFKSGEIQDQGSGITIKDLGPEEKFANDILTSLKDKISDARAKLNDLEQQIEKRTHEAETKKEEILDEARREAEEIRQEAEQEAEQLLQEKEQEVELAREDGYDEGYQDGLEDVREEMAEFLEQAGEVLEEAKHKREAFLEENTPVFIKLTGELAQRIVRETVAVDEQTVKRVVDSALDQVSDVREITLVLNPEDAEILSSVKQDYLEEYSHLEELTITEDSKMERGGCRLRTNFGDVQGALRSQIEHLTDQLIDRSRLTADGSGFDATD